VGCYNSAIIQAPVKEVWAALRKFHDLSWSANVVTDVKTEGNPEQIGAKRVLNGVFCETLLALDDVERKMRYSIDDGPDAVSKDNVSGYIGQIKVFPNTDDNSTFVLWTSRWEAGGDGTQEFCDPIYRALLADLQQHFAQSAAVH
jgi:hypothetical protein